MGEEAVRDLRDKVAVVTGAASGIGRALALALADEGAALALSDVDEAGLAATVKAAAARGTRVTQARLDVANRDAVHAYAEEVATEYGCANLVVNNAGVAMTGSIEELAYVDLEWLMGINFWGVVHGSKAFLPQLIASGEGHLVNLSSAFGLIGVPSMGAYNAAKFAVRGFSECLRQELEIARHPVSVTCVHPGAIKTQIARNARRPQQADRPERSDPGEQFERVARTRSEQAAAAILKGVKRNARRVLIGPDARLIDRIQRIAPAGYQRLPRFSHDRRVPHDAAAKARRSGSCRARRFAPLFELGGAHSGARGKASSGEIGSRGDRSLVSGGRADGRARGSA